MNQKEIKKYFAKFGKQGGEARAKKLTKEQLKESARKAARARWAKEREGSENTRKRKVSLGKL